MKRDTEYGLGYRAGWLHVAGTGKPVEPGTPSLKSGESYYTAGFEDGARTGRGALCPISIRVQPGPLSA